MTEYSVSCTVEQVGWVKFTLGAAAACTQGVGLLNMSNREDDSRETLGIAMETKCPLTWLACEKICKCGRNERPAMEKDWRWRYANTES